MSANETTQPTPRMHIAVDPTPPPPWAGVKFTCKKCRAEYQLEAADKCELRTRKPTFASYHTPPCWDCEHVNVITIEKPIGEEIGGS